MICPKCGHDCGGWRSATASLEKRRAKAVTQYEILIPMLQEQRAEGKTLAQIRDWLNGHGFKTTRGRPFTEARVWDIINRYLGKKYLGRRKKSNVPNQCVCFTCHRPLLRGTICPKCQTCVEVGNYFKTPTTDLMWQGAEELVRMGEVFQSWRLTARRIRRFVKAMNSPAVQEYLKLWPKRYQQFTYLMEHPEMLT